MSTTVQMVLIFRAIQRPPALSNSLSTVQRSRVTELDSQRLSYYLGPPPCKLSTSRHKNAVIPSISVDYIQTSPLLNSAVWDNLTSVWKVIPPATETDAIDTLSAVWTRDRGAVLAGASVTGDQRLVWAGGRWTVPARPRNRSQSALRA